MTRTNTESSTKHLPGLDLIRATAIVWVVLYHASLVWHVPGDSGVIRFGWMGVDLFFALSGYLIGGQLLRPWARGTRPEYSQFMMRRLLRTLPAYLTVVALYFLVPILQDGRSIQPLWQFLTFTQNLTLDLVPGKTFSAAWSLCVEEQFYLVCPLIVALLAIRPSTFKVVAIIVTLLILGLCIRGYLWTHEVATTADGRVILNGPRFMTFIYYPTWSRLDGLLAGVVAALVQTFRPTWWQRLTSRANILFLCGLIGVGLSMPVFGNEATGFLPTLFGYPLLACSAALLIAAASSNRCVAGRYAIPGVRALATGAYSLYLTHKMVYHLVAAAGQHWPQPLQPYALEGGLLAALAAGTCLYWSVERPFLKLRERLIAAHTMRRELIPQQR